MKMVLARSLLLLAVAIFLAGCGKSEEAAPPPPPGPPGGMKGMPGMPKATPINGIMIKLAKGPTSLNSLIQSGLNATPVNWDDLIPKSKEFVELATSFGQYDPPAGSKESWQKLSRGFSEFAVALDKGIQAKDKDAALAAHKFIAESCMECHRVHRTGPGGMGKGGFGPKNGWPVPKPGE